MTRVIDIAKEIEGFAPKFLKEDYDNVGLMVGDESKEIKKLWNLLKIILNMQQNVKMN